jgi:hypothetical protein
MTLRARDVDNMWTKLGYDVVNAGDVVATLRINGKFIAKTKRSHGARKLDGEIPHLIRKQMRLTRSEFEDAYECPLTRDAYFALLKSKGHLPD